MGTSLAWVVARTDWDGGLVKTIKEASSDGDLGLLLIMTLLPIMVSTSLIYRTNVEARALEKA